MDKRFPSLSEQANDCIDFTLEHLEDTEKQIEFIQMIGYIIGNRDLDDQQCQGYQDFINAVNSSIMDGFLWSMLIGR